MTVDEENFPTTPMEQTEPERQNPHGSSDQRVWHAHLEPQGVYDFSRFQATLEPQVPQADSQSRNFHTGSEPTTPPIEAGLQNSGAELEMQTPRADSQLPNFPVAADFQTRQTELEPQMRQTELEPQTPHAETQSPSQHDYSQLQTPRNESEPQISNAPSPLQTLQIESEPQNSVANSDLQAPHGESEPQTLHADSELQTAQTESELPTPNGRHRDLWQEAYMRTLAPSPGTPGEGWGEGDFERKTSSDDQNHPHPGSTALTAGSPLPEYQDEEQDLLSKGAATPAPQDNSSLRNPHADFELQTETELQAPQSESEPKTVHVDTEPQIPQTESELPTPNGRRRDLWQEAYMRTLAPSPGTPGEGWGEGDFERKTSFDDQNHPHPSPLAEYLEREQDLPPKGAATPGPRADLEPQAEPELQSVQPESEAQSLQADFDTQTPSTESEPQASQAGLEPETAHTDSPIQTSHAESEPQPPYADSQPQDVASDSQLETSQTESEPPLPQADVRSELIGQFGNWLDQMLADEPPPRGVPDSLLAEATAMTNGNPPTLESDLYTLFSALTGLTGEIRLQGRAFKQLSDLLSPLSEIPTALAQLHEAQAESSLAIQQAIVDQAEAADALPISFKQVCEVMIDLYDRLQRGLQTCDEGIQSLRTRRPQPGGWKQRLLGGEAGPPEQAIGSVQAIRDASGLTLARLQAALQEWGIQRIGRIGDPFDPARMTAVEVRATNLVQPGSVLVVNRSGYALNGSLKATAQVTVSKAEV